MMCHHKEGPLALGQGQTPLLGVPPPQKPGKARCVPSGFKGGGSSLRPLAVLQDQAPFQGVPPPQNPGEMRVPSGFKVEGRV